MAVSLSKIKDHINDNNDNNVDKANAVGWANKDKKNLHAKLPHITVCNHKLA